MTKSVLVIEDDLAMAQVLRQGLEQDNYSVTLAHNGWKGLELAQRGECNIIILDVMLPSLNGLSLARQLRAAGSLTPILMLTARDNIGDIVQGLDAGAEDYLTKPFSFAELLARLRSLSRRGARPSQAVYQVADLILDSGLLAASRGGVPVALSRLEFLLLEALMRNAGEVVSRDAIAEAVWGSRADAEQNNIDVLIKTLRSHIDDSFEEKLVHTVRSVGYRLGSVRSIS